MDRVQYNKSNVDKVTQPKQQQKSKKTQQLVTPQTYNFVAEPLLIHSVVCVLSFRVSRHGCQHCGPGAKTNTSTSTNNNTCSNILVVNTRRSK